MRKSSGITANKALKPTRFRYAPAVGLALRWGAYTVQWPDMLKDIVLLVLGGIGTAVWFFWRRRAEQAPVFENIQKAEKLLSLRKELDNTNYTVADLRGCTKTNLLIYMLFL